MTVEATAREQHGASADDPAAHAMDTWDRMAEQYKNRGKGSPSLPFVAIVILGYIFEGAKRRRALERRIGALEMRQKNVPQYRGIYDHGALYHEGDIATHGGTLWFCLKETHDRPGTSSWQLMVKTR